VHLPLQSHRGKRYSLNELALFAGAGGGLLASRLLGWETVCAVEINEYCRSVLCARQDDGSFYPFPIWDDVRTFDGTVWRGRIDVVSGGFPCQAYSTAARGANNADDLWPEMRRIVAEAAPRYVFAENPSRKAINCAADDLEEMGYQVRCVSLSAADLGADHLRKRFWLRAYADDESKLRSEVDAKMEIMPEFYSSVWQPKPSSSRMADGLADRMERFTATGNGQVPVVAATAWRLLSFPTAKACDPK
jgi:DNA (cytosine-5)-methyltransferase 1